MTGLLIRLGRAVWAEWSAADRDQASDHWYRHARNSLFAGLN